MTETKNKLYLCLADNGALSLQTRYEIDSWLTGVEEGQGSINQTVVGSIDVDSPIPYFFVIFKMSKATTVYDVVSAADEESARIKIASKKRYAHKLIEFKRIQSLSSLIGAFKN